MNEELMNLGVIITSLGESLIENSAISGVDLQLSKFSVGDGGSDAYNPTYEQLKALRSIPGEWDKRNLTDVYKNPEGAGFIAEGLVPHNVGEGKWCRIAGYWTASGELFAVHLIPAWQKPVNSGNMLIELPLKAYLAVSDQANISLVIDPTLVQATREYVDRQDKLQRASVLLTKAGQVVVGRRHRFMTGCEQQIPVAGEGETIGFQRDKSATGVCRLRAPQNEVFVLPNGDFDTLVIESVHRLYEFERINGRWVL